MTTLDARPNTIDVDLEALDSNVREIRRRIRPGVAIIASVKANAYGHGMVPVARSIADVDALAVARLAEAIDLRNAGIQTPIVLLAGVFNGFEE